MITAIIIFLITYYFIASEKVDKTVAALVGAGAMLLFQVATPAELLSKVDVDVLGLLIGMMIMVDILASTGFFEWLAIVIAKQSKGRGLIIVIEFLLITSILSAFLNNVTTVILIAPITILICQILEMPAVPLLILEAIFSNITGAATLIGDPPNMIIGSKAGLSFNSFIANLAPIVIIIVIVLIVLISLFFKKYYKINPEIAKRTNKTIPSLAIVDSAKMKKCLIILAITLFCFFISHSINLEPGVIAIIFAMIMIFACGTDIQSILEKIDWSTIMFFVGLFMLIGALEAAGVIDSLGVHILKLTEGHLFLTILAILWISAILSAIIDNIPLVIALIPMIQTIAPVFARSMGISGAEAFTQIEAPMLWALALGACFGGNGTLVGASANVVIARVAGRNNYPITFWKFTKYGIPITFISLIISSFYLYLRYFY